LLLKREKVQEEVASYAEINL